MEAEPRQQVQEAYALHKRAAQQRLAAALCTRRYGSLPAQMGTWRSGSPASGGPESACSPGASAAQSRAGALGAAALAVSAARAASVHAYPANTLGGGLSSPRPPSRSASRTDSGLSPRLHPLRGGRSGSARPPLRSLISCLAGPLSWCTMVDYMHPPVLQLAVILLRGSGTPGRCGEGSAAAAGQARACRRDITARWGAPGPGREHVQLPDVGHPPVDGRRRRQAQARQLLQLAVSCRQRRCGGLRRRQQRAAGGAGGEALRGPAAATLRGRPRLRLAGGGAASPALASLAGSACLRGRPRLRRGRPAAVAGAATATGASSCSGSSEAACTNLPLAAAALARCGGRSCASTAGRPPRPAARGAALSALCRRAKAAGSRASGTIW